MNINLIHDIQEYFIHYTNYSKLKKYKFIKRIKMKNKCTKLLNKIINNNIYDLLDAIVYIYEYFKLNINLDNMIIHESYLVIYTINNDKITYMYKNKTFEVDMGFNDNKAKSFTVYKDSDNLLCSKVVDDWYNIKSEIFNIIYNTIIYLSTYFYNNPVE